MYMEAYGNVGSVADSIIKKATNKMEKDISAQKKPNTSNVTPNNNNTISEDGVSPMEVGVGNLANTEAIYKTKAQENLTSQIKNLQERKEYLSEMVSLNEAKARELGVLK